MTGGVTSRYPGLVQQTVARGPQAREAQRAAAATGPLPLAQLVKLVREIEGMMPGLPEATQRQVRPSLAEAKREMDRDAPDTTRIAGHLMAIRAACARVGGDVDRDVGRDVGGDAGGDILAAAVVGNITRIFVDNAGQGRQGL